LADAYGYTISLPSTRQTFLAVLNTTTHTLTLNADPQAPYGRNTMTIDAQAGRVSVDDVTSSFPPGSVGGITVLSGDDATVNVDSTVRLMPVTVNLGTSSQATVGQASRFLDNIQGDVTIHGNAFTGYLAIYDENDIYPDTYTITDHSVQRDVSAAISYDNLSVLQLAGSLNAGTTYNVESSANGTSTQIYAGRGRNTFNLCPAGHNLGTIRGSLYLGSVGSATLAMYDAYVDAYTVVWNSTTVGRLPQLSLTYNNIAHYDLYTRPGSSVTDFVGIGGSWFYNPFTDTWVWRDPWSPLTVHYTL
jgi:hypothetical protein